MGRLDGRVAIVTGAGRGLGRAHALMLAEQGAHVVVNDRGGDIRGDHADSTPAQRVVAEIEAVGSRAVASDHDVSDWAQARELVDLALDAFGDLHVLVNNAGIMRDRTLANLDEEDWDAVVRVHLKGHAAPTRHAVGYWRARAKAGDVVRASVVHTTSIAGFAGNFGQASYASAKLGVLALSQVVALEAGRFGVRSNAVSPTARTRMLFTVPGAEKRYGPPDDHSEFDTREPANVSPLVAWLAQAGCPATGQVFHVHGSRLIVLAMPTAVHDLRTEGRWTLEALDRELPPRLLAPPTLDDFVDDIAR